MKQLARETGAKAFFPTGLSLARRGLRRDRARAGDPVRDRLRVPQPDAQRRLPAGHGPRQRQPGRAAADPDGLPRRGPVTAGRRRRDRPLVGFERPAPGPGCLLGGMGSRSLSRSCPRLASFHPRLGPAAASPGGPSPPRQAAPPGRRSRPRHHRPASSPAIPPRRSAGATVTIEETGQSAVSGAGRRLPLRRRPARPRTTCRVSAESFTPTRVEVRVASSAGTTVDVSLEPELHYAEVVSVGVKPRDPFEAYQPTSVLSGQDLVAQDRGLAGRAAQDRARRRAALARPGAVAAGHPRPGRRSRPDPARTASAPTTCRASRPTTA